MTNTTTTNRSNHQATVNRRYLTLELGSESYGVAVLKVREIIRTVEISPVPQMPPHVRGVINLRGKIIPIVDLRLKFGLENTGSTDRTCIVVVQTTNPSGQACQTGLIVDAVQEVITINESDIEEAPSFGTAVDTSYILALAKIKGNVTILLDIERVLSDDAR